MDRIQLISVIVTALMFVFVFELVRRRRLMERYALLWMASSVVLLVLAVWTGLLERLADLAGIQVPSNALFVVGFAFVLALLLNFSLAISRLTDETKVLAQEVARLSAEARGQDSAAREAQERPVEPQHQLQLPRAADPA